MTKELMSLEEISRIEERGFTSITTIVDELRRLFETAKAAHEWKAENSALEIKHKIALDTIERQRSDINRIRNFSISLSRDEATLTQANIDNANLQAKNTKFFEVLKVARSSIYRILAEPQYCTCDAQSGCFTAIARESVKEALAKINALGEL